MGLEFGSFGFGLGGRRNAKRDLAFDGRLDCGMARSLARLSMDVGIYAGDGIAEC